MCGPFSGGTASTLPFLPRLTYRRTVLSPARWTVSATDLLAKTTSWTAWTAGVAEWRDRMMVPAAVYLGSSGQRVRLNLNEPAHLRGREIPYQQLPLDQVRHWAGDEIADMFQRFEDNNDFLDIEALHTSYPGVAWHSYADWARTVDWDHVLRTPATVG